jgi:hypothetical protein
MIVEVDIKDYYKAFINNANSDINKYQGEYDTNHRLLLSTKDYISKYILYINHQFGINLTNDYPVSWGQTEYCKTEELTKTIQPKLATAIGEDRIILLQLLRYSELLKFIYHCKRKIELAKTRSNITPKQYKEYLRKYYMQSVHKALIDGYAYRFSSGIGDLMINYWKYVKGVRSKIVDWNATNKRKQEILDAGLKLYNKDEAEIYKIRGLKYDGIPYVVYKTNNEYYNIELLNSTAFSKNNIKFKHANYIPAKFRKKTTTDIANEFDSVDSIATQDLGIRHKLIVCLDKDPTIYLRYVRNVEAVRQKRGTHTTRNSKKADTNYE